MTRLDVTRYGEGPAVVLVHGSVVGADRTWAAQRPLGRHWTIVAPDRPGFGDSPPLTRGDFEAEAPLVADVLGDGAHLVGHSYGAVIALLAAAQRPDAVWSLTVSEPGCLRVAAGHPAVDAMIAHGDRLVAVRDGLPPAEFLRLFRHGAGSSRPIPSPLPDWLARGTAHAMRERPPWEAEIPLETLARAPFPKLVISGAHSDAFEAVCDALADRVKARRAHVPGRAHSIPSAGEAYNACVHAFLSEAERARPRFER